MCTRFLPATSSDWSTGLRLRKKKKHGILCSKTSRVTIFKGIHFKKAVHQEQLPTAAVWATSSCPAINPNPAPSEQMRTISVVHVTHLTIHFGRQRTVYQASYPHSAHGEYNQAIAARHLSCAHMGKQIGQIHYAHRLHTPIQLFFCLILLSPMMWTPALPSGSHLTPATGLTHGGRRFSPSTRLLQHIATAPSTRTSPSTRSWPPTHCERHSKI